MSNINKQTVQAVADLKAGYTLGHADIAMLKSMARQLLASMEQEPVAWEVKGILCHTRAEANVYVGEPEPLYAAPQLPQPSVPLVNLPSEFYSSEGVMVQLEKVMAALAVCGIQYRRKVNACRAAMLNGSEPVQRWIPCSERMPKVGEYVLCLDGLDRHGQFAHDDVYTAAYCDRLEAFTTEYYGDHDWMSKSNPTHWAPIPKMPAAPQQEVKK